MFADTKRKIARKCLNDLLESKDKELYTDLAIAATAIANRMMMDWLDMKRVNHCKDCQETEQLIAINKVYFCGYHGKNNSVKPLELCK